MILNFQYDVSVGNTVQWLLWLCYRLEGPIGPDVCYVEQAQDTLVYIQKLGIPAIAAKWYALILIDPVLYWVYKLKRSIRTVYSKDMWKRIMKQQGLSLIMVFASYHLWEIGELVTYCLLRSVHLDKLMVTLLVKIFVFYMELKGSFLCSHDTLIKSYYKADKFFILSFLS